MAHTYRIEPTRELVVVTGGRRWSGEDLLDSRTEVVRDSDFAPAFDWVYDLRRVLRVAFSPEQMKRALGQFRMLRSRGWIECSSRAVLVGRDQDVRLTGELYYRKIDCPSSRFHIARTLGEASRWLAAKRSGRAAELR